MLLRGEAEARGNPRPRYWQACAVVAVTQHGPGVVGVLERSVGADACGRGGERHRVSGESAACFESAHTILCVIVGADVVATEVFC
mmetsp:Transcript_27348/g.63080  ORF Transcript_27348/g.63080 Transcript_27348/m.63080 type:complete len:86 (-) Transcript_27348:146-403(-)